MKKTQTHLMYGGLTGLAMVVLGLILYVVGLSFEQWAQWLSYIPFLAGIILNAQAYSKANEADITFGNAFASGFKATLIITAIVLVWSFISLAIFPEMREKSIEIAIESMESRGLSEEQIQQSMDMTEKYLGLFMAMGIIFGLVFFGTIFSLIAAAIAKKNPRPQVHDHL